MPNLCVAMGDALSAFEALNFLKASFSCDMISESCLCADERPVYGKAFAMDCAEIIHVRKVHSNSIMVGNETRKGSSWRTQHIPLTVVSGSEDQHVGTPYGLYCVLPLRLTKLVIVKHRGREIRLYVSRQFSPVMLCERDT